QAERWPMMTRARIVIAAGALALVGIAAWLATRPKTASPRIAEDAAVAAPLLPDVALAVASASAAPADDPPWLPSGKACRHAIPHGATFDRISDASLAALLVEGFDPKTQRFPMR